MRVVRRLLQSFQFIGQSMLIFFFEKRVLRSVIFLVGLVADCMVDKCWSNSDVRAIEGESGVDSTYMGAVSAHRFVIFVVVQRYTQL